MHPECIVARQELADSFKPINIAIRQGAVLPLSDYKNDPRSQFNATKDTRGLFGLSVGGTDR